MYRREYFTKGQNHVFPDFCCLAAYLFIYSLQTQQVSERFLTRPETPSLKLCEQKQAENMFCSVLKAFTSIAVF